MVLAPVPPPSRTTDFQGERSENPSKTRTCLRRVGSEVGAVRDRGEPTIPRLAHFTVVVGHWSLTRRPGRSSPVSSPDVRVGRPLPSALVTILTHDSADYPFDLWIVVTGLCVQTVGPFRGPPPRLDLQGSPCPL